jgi:hypothetical protein
MPTPQEVRAQIKRLGFKRIRSWMVLREIKQLPQVLLDGENIKSLVYGRYQHRHGILVATDQRLIFLEKRLFSLHVESFDYHKIAAVGFSTGILFGSLEIHVSGNHLRINGIDKTRIQPLVATIRKRIAQSTGPLKTETLDDDILIKLERLARLKEQGVITSEELLEQKKRILVS